MVIDKLAWLYLQEGRILSTRSKEKNVRYIPWGKRESGESDTEALKREIKEELSVDLQDETIALYWIFEAQAHGKAEGIIVRMTCYTADYTWVLQCASEIEAFERLSYADKERSSPVDWLIFDDLHAKGLLF